MPLQHPVYVYVCKNHDSVSVVDPDLTCQPVASNPINQ